MTTMTLCCPVCRAALQQQDKRLQCENGHSFDAAKQGYWNLLLSHKKRSKDPGDNPEMVVARQQFLNKGHYQPLAAATCRLINNHLQTANPAILDMGCGEGYYTEQIASSLAEQQPDVIGLDISKHAVKAACRRSKEIRWLVGSGADLPVADHSLDLITVMFCRLMPQPLAQAIAKDGLLLLAWPGENHLIELRQMIYKEIRPSGYDPVAMLEEQFQPLSTEQVSYPFELTDPADIQALLSMTPHSQRMPASAKAQLEQQNQLALTLDVNLAILRRK